MIDNDDITRQLQDWIDQMEKSGKQAELDKINRYVSEFMHAQNAIPRPDFNGFSSKQMHQMINRPLEAGCPVQLRQLTEEHSRHATGSAPDECVGRK